MSEVNPYSVKLAQVFAFLAFAYAVYSWRAAKTAGYTAEEVAHRSAVKSQMKKVRKSARFDVTKTDRQSLESLLNSNKTRYLPAKLCDWRCKLSFTPQVRAGEITDADGRSIYVAYVAEYRLAHRDKEELIESALTIANDINAEGEVTPTFAEWWYDESLLDGRVDISEGRRRLRGDTLTRIQSNVFRATDGLDDRSIRQRIRDKIFGGKEVEDGVELATSGIEATKLRREMVYRLGYPEDVYEEQLKTLLMLNKIQRVGDRYQYVQD